MRLQKHISSSSSNPASVGKCAIGIPNYCSGLPLILGHQRRYPLDIVKMQKNLGKIKPSIFFTIYKHHSRHSLGATISLHAAATLHPPPMYQVGSANDVLRFIFKAASSLMKRHTTNQRRFLQNSSSPPPLYTSLPSPATVLFSLQSSADGPASLRHADLAHL